MKILSFALFILPYFFATIFANDASLPNEILTYYYAYKAQWAHGTPGWQLFYHLEGPELLTFGEWAPRLMPAGRPWAGWAPEPSDNTDSPDLYNAERFSQYAPINGRYEMRGISFAWDQYYNQQYDQRLRDGRTPLPGLASLLRNLQGAFNTIFTGTPNALSSADLDTMKEALQGVLAARAQVNWDPLSRWLTNDATGGDSRLAPFLVDEDGHPLTICDTRQILENITRATGFQTGFLQNLVTQRINNFGTASYANSHPTINWSRDWGGADVHRRVIDSGRNLVAVLESLASGASELPENLC